MFGSRQTTGSGLPRITLVQPSVGDATYPSVPFGIEPLNLLVLAALTPRDRFRVRVLDGMVGGPRRSMVDPTTALTGITVVTPARVEAYRIAGEYRKRGIPVVLGGCHVTLDPDDAASHADAIVVGEAEKLWPEVLDDFLHGRLRKEYRNETAVEFDTPADRSAVDGYRRRYPFLTVLQTTRGCPNSCEFCVPAVTMGQRIRHRPVESVVAEIRDAMGRYSRKTFGFTDDNLFGDLRYARQLLEALVPLRIRWAAQMCVDVARDDGVLDLMAASGCFAGFFGFESVDRRVLRDVGKSVDVEEYPDLIRKIRDRGIVVIGSFTLGHDRDDYHVYDRTVDFCRRTGIEIPLFVALMPYKGTRLFERLTREGRITSGVQPGSNPLVLNYRPLNLDPNRFALRVAEMYEQYYDVRYLWRNLRHWVRRRDYRRGLLLVALYSLYVAFARRLGRGRYVTTNRRDMEPGKHERGSRAALAGLLAFAVGIAVGAGCRTSPSSGGDRVLTNTVVSSAAPRSTSDGAANGVGAATNRFGRAGLAPGLVVLVSNLQWYSTRIVTNEDHTVYELVCPGFNDDTVAIYSDYEPRGPSSNDAMAIRIYEEQVRRGTVTDFGLDAALDKPEELRDSEVRDPVKAREMYLSVVRRLNLLYKEHFSRRRGNMSRVKVPFAGTPPRTDPKSPTPSDVPADTPAHISDSKDGK